RDHMRAGDLAAVIHLGLSAQGVEFSGSKAQLLEAIDAVRGSAGYSGQSPTPPIGAEGTPAAPGSQPDVELGPKERARPSDAEVFNVAPLARMESLILSSNAEKSYEMLELAAEYVAGFTGRRKSMMLFTSGVPINLTGMEEPASRFRRAHEKLVAMAQQS